MGEATRIFWAGWFVMSIAGAIILTKLIGAVLEWMDERWPL